MSIRRARWPGRSARTAPGGPSAGGRGRRGQDGGSGDDYTCVMHPEVVQDHPGDCPKCGMHLVPKK